MTPAEIIAKLEAATEGSRELSVAIWWALMSADERKAHDPTSYMAETFASKGRYVGIFVDTSQRPSDRTDFAPDYTTSLDAALTLVPHGWAYIVHGPWEDAVRREIGAILPVLLQGAFMAGAAVVLLLGWARWATGGLFQ